MTASPASSGGFAIRVEGLTKTFHKAGHRLDVLRGIDLVLEAGERVAIVGQSGSGKSTFLHILGTLDRPTSGKIWFRGSEVFTRSEAQLDSLRNREIGFVFQFHHLLPDHDAVHNVMMPLLIAGESAPRAKATASALLERVGLGGRLTHRPGELSGGEQQRVAIARALVRKPALVLADEPTGNLDPTTAADIFDMFLDINREHGSTVVVVTHSVALADRFPRTLHLQRGTFVDSTVAGSPT
jgi:lipoprotein-releasing system ATP-binding protein